MDRQLVLLDGHDARLDMARFSDDGRFRYELTRELGGDTTLLSIGVNPSKANATKNDRTIHKDIGFAKFWGFGRILKLNAYAYVATDPYEMKRAAKAGIDVVGPDNDRTIHDALETLRKVGGRLLVSWGNHIDPRRQAELALLIMTSGVEPLCLGTNQNGTPCHELYLPYDRKLIRWSPP